MAVSTLASQQPACFWVYSPISHRIASTASAMLSQLTNWDPMIGLCEHSPDHGAALIVDALLEAVTGLHRCLRLPIPLGVRMSGCSHNRILVLERCHR